MLRFISYLEEHVISIGYNPKHEKFREQHRQEIHDLMHHAYKAIGGYSGHKSGSEEESKAIHDDISKHNIKAVKRDGKISAVNIYKNQHGRKLVAVATNGTEQGKKDWKKISTEDNEHKRAWGEVSGAVEKIHQKLGFPKVPSKHAEKLLGKKVTPVSGDEHKYTRKIGEHEHEKTIMGHPKTTK